jgi:DNA polymerase I-like protein with 3'-5' exonuclease and polymerase domains
MLSNIGKNNPIQAAGANMIKLAMISIDREIAPLVLQVHDELVAEVKKTQAVKAMKHMEGVMNKAADYCTGVPGLIKVKPVIAMNLLKQK